jgi:hypothetical protein
MENLITAAMHGGGGMGGGGHGGGGGGEETASNNLSQPVIFTEGVALTLSGSPNTFSFETPYDLDGDGQITEADRINGYYLFAQKTNGNLWQADSLLIPLDDLNTTNLFVSSIDWGDSIEGGKPIAIGRPTRIEVSFYKNLSAPLSGDVALDPTMTAYPMQLLANPSSSTEVQGASASSYPISGELPFSPVLTQESTEASVYAETAKLALQYITGTPEANDFIWNAEYDYWVDADITDSVTIEAPISGLSFGGEVTVSGKVVYGLSQGGWSPGKAGTYRATVFFPKTGNLQLGQAEILVSTEPSAVTAITLAEGDGGGEEPPTESGPGAQIDGINNLTYLDIFVNGNQPPIVLPILLGKTEDDPDFTLSLVSTATDPEGDVLTASNVAFLATNGTNPITLPVGTVEVQGSNLLVRPSMLNSLNAGQKIIIQTSFSVSDGVNLSPSTATITIDGRDEALPPPSGGGGSVSSPGSGDSPREPFFPPLGTPENDIIRGTKGDDLLQGRQGNDTLFGDSGNDVLRGGKDNDFLQGGMGDDLIYGDLGNDILDGGKGFDVLTGGFGEDIFRVMLQDMTEGDKQPDRILDFDLRSDRIDLDDSITRQMLTFNNDMLIAQINGQAILLVELSGLSGLSGLTGLDLISQIQIV